MIGNAHIDPVWLWGWQAGADEVLATFRSAADRCDEYPDFIFTAGEAWRYSIVEDVDPALFARIKALIRDRRWHVIGGQWVQPDLNLPTATGLMRQLEIGSRYFRDRFGLESTVGYSVDAFGHPATLPGLLRASGIDAYVFCRPNPEQVPLPANTFRWRGSDGAEVVAFRLVPTYVTRSANLRGQVMLAVESSVAELGHTMCFYGIGNHGGGPTKRQIEWISANRHEIPDVELRFSTPAAFFESISDRVPDLPVVTEELQHVFPGCYSVMHDIKRAQRHGEHLLQQAGRALEAFEPDAAAAENARAALEAGWRDLAFTQFHDILSGSSAPSAWASARAIQGRARAAGEEVLFGATRRWARTTLGPVTDITVAAINSDDEAWEGIVESEPWLDGEEWNDRWLSDAEGLPIPFQLVQPETPLGLTRLLFPATIPARSAVQVRLREAPPAAEPIANSGPEATTTGARNTAVELELGPRGIRSLRVRGREVLGSRGVSLHLREDTGDTWVFTSDNLPGRVTDRVGGLQWALEERGPLRVRYRAETDLGRSRLRWTVDLVGDEPAVRVRLEVNFAERHRALQLSTDLVDDPAGWRDGLPGGSVERTPGSSEWPVHGWSHVALPIGHLAWVTHDAYSISLKRRQWQWTLLRSPRMGWMGENDGVYSGRDWYTDEGPHEFDLLLAFGDVLEEATLDRLARTLVEPPVVFDRYEGLDRPPWGDAPPRSMETGAEGRDREDLGS